MKGAALALRFAGSMASVAGALGPNAIARADEPCIRVVAPTELSAGWVTAVADLRKHIEKLPTSDCETMTLSLEPRDGVMRIVVMTSDGRWAERIVRHSDSLVAIALGLVMTIPSGQSAASPIPDTSPGRSSSVQTEPQPTSPAAELATAAAPKTIALWTGLSGGIRLTAPTSLSVLDVEARADILLDSWLVLVTVRSALISCLGQQGVDCDVYNDVSAGVGVGRRFRAGGPDIDIAFEPSLVVMHMEYDTAAGTEGPSVEGTEVVLRLDASARLAVPVDRHWVFTVTLDGGLAPSMLANPTTLQLPLGTVMGSAPPPPYPAWSGGVRLGASGALL